MQDFSWQVPFQLQDLKTVTAELTCQIHVVAGVKSLEKELISDFILDHLLIACQKIL